MKRRNKVRRQNARPPFASKFRWGLGRKDDLQQATKRKRQGKATQRNVDSVVPRGEGTVTQEAYPNLSTT